MDTSSHMEAQLPEGLLRVTYDTEYSYPDEWEPGAVYSAWTVQTFTLDGEPVTPERAAEIIQANLDRLKAVTTDGDPQVRRD